MKYECCRTEVYEGSKADDNQSIHFLSFSITSARVIIPKYLLLIIIRMLAKKKKLGWCVVHQLEKYTAKCRDFT